MLNVKSLACRRGRRLVFRGVGFDLAAGVLLSVRGRNGSGKSSLLRALAGLLPVFEGEIIWQGAAVTDFAAQREHLHYLGHLNALKSELTPVETFAYWHALHGIPLRGGDVLEQFGLASLRTVPIRHLSAGQKRRLALARLTIGDALLWLLDEPATSLDETGRVLLTQLIERHRAKGGMAIIATHDDDKFNDASQLILDGAP